MFLHKRFSADLWERCCFDPGTLMISSMAATGIGGVLSAGSTIAGGNMAAEAGRMQRFAADREATQIEMNAAQAFASGQRKALDTQEKTRLVASTARANAAGNGTNVAVGSNVTNEGQIARRGSYNAAVDMFNGESARTGMLNQAEGVRYGGRVAEYEGEAKRDASLLSAAGTIAGSAGSMMSTYGNYRYPQLRGRA